MNVARFVGCNHNKSMKAIKRTRIADLLKSKEHGIEVNVRGWVRTRRSSKQVAFVALNDGSTINNVQVVIDVENFDEELVKQFTTGACWSVNGMLVESIGGGQAVEIQATEIELLGACDNTYPLQKKGQTMEFMRTVAHLRPRTNTFGAVFRIRHNMAYAIHKFFHDKGFYYFHTPLITASDCEGAGQMFQVTTMNLYDLKKEPDSIRSARRRAGGNSPRCNLHFRSYFPCRELEYTAPPC